MSRVLAPRTPWPCMSCMLNQTMYGCNTRWLRVDHLKTTLGLTCGEGSGWALRTRHGARVGTFAHTVPHRGSTSNVLHGLRWVIYEKKRKGALTVATPIGATPRRQAPAISALEQVGVSALWRVSLSPHCACTLRLCTTHQPHFSRRPRPRLHIIARYPHKPSCRRTTTHPTRVGVIPRDLVHLCVLQ